MAVDLMKPPIDPGKVPPRLGMDHRAVVWCHNLLEPTVEVLAALRHDEKDPGQSQQERGERWNAYRSARPGKTTEGVGYDAAVRNQYLRLRVRVLEGRDSKEDATCSLRLPSPFSSSGQTSFGPWRATALEASALYNAEWIVSLYSAISLFYWCFVAKVGLATLVAVPSATSTFAWAVSSASYLSWWNLCVLSGAAHSVFCGIRALLLLLRFRCRRRASVQLEGAKRPSAPAAPSRPLSAILAHVPLLMCVLAFAGSFRRGDGSSGLMGPLELVLAGSCLAGTYALAIYLATQSHARDGDKDRLLVLVAWMLPVLPFLLAGEVAFAVRRRTVSGTFWPLVLPFVAWLTLQYHRHRVALGSSPPTHSSRSPGTRRSANVKRILLAALCSWRLFRTLWTSEQLHDGIDLASGGAPLVYQVLALVLAVSSAEVLAGLLWRGRSSLRARGSKDS
jgi:hypothetical protein